MGSLPEVIGPYRIVRQLGEGGMGAVYEGVNEAIERRVAIKLLHPEYARSAEMAARFINEARAVNRVEHPGIVQISDHGQLPDGTAYIVMECLKGETLASRIERSGGTMPLSDSLQLAWQLADSLAAAHAKGIIHRDIKPQNVMLVPDSHMPIGERTKLLDFGLAKVSTPGGAPHVRTSGNSVMGTPLYMSPEQCAGAGKVDAKSDVYSLGCMLHEMLSGRPPFSAEGAGEILGMHMFKQPEPLRKVAPAVPAPVADLVMRLLSKNRDQRPSMKQLTKELETLFRLAPPPVRRESVEEEPLDEATAQQLGNASTLSRAAFEHKNSGRRRWRYIGLVGAAVGVLSVGFGASLVRKSSSEGQPLAQKQPLRLAAAKPEPPALPAPVERREPTTKRVSIQIDSQPSGAAVIRLADGQRLGETPWRLEQDAQAGQLALRLRRDGFKDSDVTVELDRDRRYQQTLSAIDAAVPPGPTSKRKVAGGRPPKPRQLDAAPHAEPPSVAKTTPVATPNQNATLPIEE